MQPRPKVPHLKDLLWWSLFLAPVTAAALQQQPQHAYTSRAALDRLSDAAASSQERWRASAPDTLDPPVSGQRFKDTHAENRSRSRSREKQRTSNNERALATYAPADSNPAVRAPPASRSSATAGLTSRQPARSLQDWQVEDIVLLATVDGKLHARDRTTGAARWQLEVDTPMVETSYHRHNRSVDGDGSDVDDLIWIVEPSQDGQIYVYVPGSGLGMQRLGYTVKELADLAPYAGDGHLAISYTAEKKNTLYTIDAGTGNILKVFSSAGAITNDDRSCRRVNSLESLEEDDEKCEPIGTLLLGRTEYTIGVNTLNGVNTIKYFEWGPNNRDQDLKSKYTATMDRKYVYSRYDGSVFGLDLGTHDDYSPVPANKPVYREKFSSPVARVFDVVRPSENPSRDAALVVLPQPVGPALDELSSLDADTVDNVFVNCTESGSWYALSETNYPAVTEGAQTARCYSDDSVGIPVVPMSKAYRDRFMGVHQLSPIGHRTGTPKIGAADYPVIDPPPEIYSDAVQLLTPDKPGWKSHLPSVRMVLMTIIVASLAACATLYRERLRSAVQSPPAVPELAATVLELPVVTDEQSEAQTPTMIREGEPATETMAVLERWQDAYEPTQLIEWMLEPQPENRPTALQVLTHPFFWTAEKRLAFLCDASDHFEREARGTVDDDYAGDSFDLRLLEDRVGDVIGGRSDFLAKLDRQFVDTLGKQRKYSGNRLLDLLRALRNKKNHYEDMPAEVKARVGPLAGGYLRYWTDRFPLLLMTCYEVIHQVGIQESDRFRGYFSHDLGAM
ncbi:bifunctional endoribonuclease/protein kinase ire1 [Friedmanniomyces endolithicus]|nr:bifunctional endoribonuclease/protein kinase ire1 [Friedmanniomyces endolithicus]